MKDFIKDLTDEGQVKVEKIGTGNWYWCFGDDEKKMKEKELDRLKLEVQKNQNVVDELTKKRDETKKDREAKDQDPEYQSLATQALDLEAEVRKLTQEKDELERSIGGGGIEQMKDDIERWKEEVSVWTNNIYILEGQLRGTLGVDREALQALQREIYGTEYVEEEEGLRDLESI